MSRKRVRKPQFRTAYFGGVISGLGLAALSTAFTEERPKVLEDLAIFVFMFGGLLMIFGNLLLSHAIHKYHQSTLNPDASREKKD